MDFRSSIFGFRSGNRVCSAGNWQEAITFITLRHLHVSARSGNENPKSKIIFILMILLCAIADHAWGAFVIVQDNRPSCSVVAPDNLSAQEEFAVEELEYLVERFTGLRLGHRTDSEPLPDGNIILAGTYNNNRYVAELYEKGLVSAKKDLSGEEYIVKVVSDGGRDFLVITGGQDRGVIYGVYALAEKIIESITGLNPADLDFHTAQTAKLEVEMLNIQSAPFYPIRCALSQEDPAWISRHKINVSGAEGVWSGTGVDDGLGTAFKYVLDSQFDEMQDESLSRRWSRISNLQARLRELKVRGIDSYLFMYVMGEPTKSMMENHPELLEGKVQYKNSRNGDWYTPISWTKPEARAMISELVKSIVRTYSPWLTGFHLRSWGAETRAPAGNNEDQQKSLWEIYFDIITAARSVNPDFKFLISGYDQYWLKDPERIYAERLPQGTILMYKWGVDGEPTSDPGIPVEFINTVGSLGHSVLILSHDVEEVMPLWMIEADMFAAGVRKYADDHNVNGLGGFTLQGEVGLAHLDRIVSARIGCDPYEDYVALMHNYLISYYGQSAAHHILAALRINSLTMADYFSDYAFSLSLTGKYGDGSRGYATRFWNIIGQEAAKDTLSISDFNTVEHAKKRFTLLLPRQQEAANEMASAKKLVQPVSNEAESDYSDGLHLMKMWVCFFESRLRLVEALEAGFGGNGREQIMQKIYSAIEYSREMQMEINEIRKFSHVFGHDDRSARESLIAAIDKEMEFLRNFELEAIIALEQDKESEDTSLSITELICYPNPMNGRATFCYTLTSHADEAKINIYTIKGRRIRTIPVISAKRGYNEIIWVAEDDDGRKLANGTYIYKMVAERGEKKAQMTGKLSIVR